LGQTQQAIIDPNVDLTPWAGWLSVEPTYLMLKTRQSTATVLCWFSGNRSGKTLNAAAYTWDSIQGVLPHERFNMRPDLRVRKYRFCAQTLPIEKEGEAESKNTIYPALKRIIPPQFIKKDITARNQTVTVIDPQGGPNVYLEFCSYSMTDQATAGVERFFIYEDECPPFSYHQEQMARLLTTNGRLIMGLTSVDANWTYEELFERAKRIYRSKAVVFGYKKHLNRVVPFVENTDSKEDIEVIQIATDDNPILPKVIEDAQKKDPEAATMTVDDLINRFINSDDPDMVPMRRYSIFKQISGSIFKDFSWNTHFISKQKYFSEGVPSNWRHGLGVDYHEDNSWPVLWVALSPENEAFAWQESEYSMESWTTLPVCQDVHKRNEDYNIEIALSDPRMAINQPSLGISVQEDANKILHRMNAHMYFRSWDTKSQKGRDAIKTRLHNSKIVGKPFNNKIVKGGIIEYLPTLWILDTCPKTAKSLKNWRYKEPRQRNAAVETDMNGDPQQKWSHFCMDLEALFKYPGFKPKNERTR